LGKSGKKGREQQAKHQFPIHRPTNLRAMPSRASRFTSRRADFLVRSTVQI
jgi:hypothetical protein